MKYPIEGWIIWIDRYLIERRTHTNLNHLVVIFLPRSVLLRDLCALSLIPRCIYNTAKDKLQHTGYRVRIFMS